MSEANKQSKYRNRYFNEYLYAEFTDKGCSLRLNTGKYYANPELFHIPVEHEAEVWGLINTTSVSTRTSKNDSIMAAHKIKIGEYAIEGSINRIDNGDEQLAFMRMFIEKMNMEHPSGPTDTLCFIEIGIKKIIMKPNDSFEYYIKKNDLKNKKMTLKIYNPIKGV